MICIGCDDEGEQAGIRPALAQRARRIESGLPGEPASEQDWRILLGQESGSLPWPVMLRLMSCLEEAAKFQGAQLECV